MFSWFKQKGKVAESVTLLPLLYPAPLSTDFIELAPDTDPATIEGNKIVSLTSIGGLTIHLLRQSNDGTGLVVTNRVLGELGLSQEEALEQALRNLENDILPTIKILSQEEDGEELLRYIDGAGSYTASLLLLPAFWQKCRVNPQSVAVAIPHRDVLAFTLSKREEDIVRLRTLSRLYFEDEEQNPKYLLANTVFTLVSVDPPTWRASEQVH